jgi:hypothetical protein
MTLIKKCDVPNYFATRRHARTQPCTPISQPDVSASKPGANPGKPSKFRKDFLGEHSQTSPRPIAPRVDEGREAL